MVKINRGFTLIEMMIVVVIVGVLAAIAMPSYKNYQVKVKRGETQSELLNIAAKLKRYKITNFHYKKTANTTIGLSDIDVSSTTHNGLYQLSLSFPATSVNGASVANFSNWVLVATPVATGMQNGNGAMCIDANGQRHWSKTTTAANCAAALSATSNWDDR